jgi:hypothetical protein
MTEIHERKKERGEKQTWEINTSPSNFMGLFHAELPEIFLSVKSFYNQKQNSRNWLAL